MMNEDYEEYNNEEGEDEEYEDTILTPDSGKHVWLVFVPIPFIVIIIAVLFLFDGLELHMKFWWAGFFFFLFAMVLYLVFGSSAVGGIARIFSAVLFTMGVLFFFLAVWYLPVAPDDVNNKTIGLIAIALIMLFIFLLLVFARMRKGMDKKRTQSKRAVKVMIKKKN